MSKLELRCYEDHFQVFERDQFGQDFYICSFWSYEGDSFDAFVKFLEEKQFRFEVVEME